MKTTTRLDAEDYTYEKDFPGEFIVIDVEACLKEEYRNAKYELVLCTGGNGAYGDHIGTGVFFRWLDGDTMKVSRSEYKGTATPKCLMQWYKAYGNEIKDEGFKEKLLAKLEGKEI